VNEYPEGISRDLEEKILQDLHDPCPPGIAWVDQTVYFTNLLGGEYHELLHIRVAADNLVECNNIGGQDGFG
jgi:hypothetical protein